MVTAYILVQTEVGKAAQVAKDMIEITGVQQAEDVTGPYDVIARAEARNLDELGKLWSRACRRSTASPGLSPVRWCASSAAQRVRLDHLLVYGRQQQRQRQGPNRCGLRRAAASRASRSLTPTNGPELRKQSLKTG